jgi:hypothetical protein
LSSVAVEQHGSPEPLHAVYLIDANSYRGQVIVNVRRIEGLKDELALSIAII